MTTISAKTILRSRNATRPDKVLSTLLLRYPRWIHAEFMTHRVFSRNAASSRAIPVDKLIGDVIENPAVPLFWGKNQKGMQASEECDRQVRDVFAEREQALIAREPSDFADSEGKWQQIQVSREQAWLRARNNAIVMARAFASAGYHKQIVNRLLEPFSHITVLVSSTEWDNFLELRDHPDAEPHIQMLAREIRKCLEDESTIQALRPYEWHLPFITEEERQQYPTQKLIVLSVARCASTSYKTVDGFDMTLERAEAIFDKLVTSQPMHASPTEHVAQRDGWVKGDHGEHWQHPELHGNFEGFIQYRKLLEAQNLRAR